MLAINKQVVDDNIICLSATCTAHACTSAWCMQHSSTAAAQNSQLHFSWAMAPRAEYNDWLQDL